MMIDLAELDAMPDEVLRGVRDVVMEELRFRSEQRAMHRVLSVHAIDAARHRRYRDHAQQIAEAAWNRWTGDDSGEVF